MNKNHPTGREVRQTFIDFFEGKGHRFVRSSSLVPGGDSTLLFTNAGMVQFKDVFLGTDQRDYTRAVNSQKCMRVAGKHNDLDDVGRNDTHHTFFEMLGNWSFGDYYKEEAITWAWELLTEVWGLNKDQLFTTVFKDEQDQIPADQEAVEHWKKQPGFNPDHLFYLGRKENFWEMGDSGPCGPCSEIHYDLRPEEGPVTEAETLNTDRFVEIWNLVFMQYNRKGPDHLDPLPNTHVDTGLGLERLVSILQDVNSNYRTDLLLPLMKATQKLTGDSDLERDQNITPYRVIADHARAATFLIADGVVPGNLGRNYVCRMIIRRAYRFGGHLGLNQPFLAAVADQVIENYQEAYPELKRNRMIILNTITKEEDQFQDTLENATIHLDNLLKKLRKEDKTFLPGEKAADLYTTYGMPLEITKDISEEQGLTVDEDGFRQAMEKHRVLSGGGSAMGDLGGKEVELYHHLLTQLQEKGELDSRGVRHDPYQKLSLPGKLIALVSDGKQIPSAAEGDPVNVIVPQTPFYIEAGGQVSDTGQITGDDWKIAISDVYQPAAGIIVHQGTVEHGTPRIGDPAQVTVDAQRRKDIMRNHTGTHLLHAALDQVIGEHARQAGSLVAPDRLRFDFTHHRSLTTAELEEIEAEVNHRILENHPLNITHKSLQQAIDEGARALFGEKYSETVRTIKMGDFSYELCGGTHCQNTRDVGLFLILSESSVAAGIRRIEAVTGRKAYQLVQKRFHDLKQTARLLSTNPDQVVEQTQQALNSISSLQKTVRSLREKLAYLELIRALDKTTQINGITILTAVLEEAGQDALRQMADKFSQKYPQRGIAVLGTIIDEAPRIVAVVTEDLIPEGFHAGDLVQFVAEQVGGGGGGRPTLAHAGGVDSSQLIPALDSVPNWVQEKTA